MIAIVQLVIVVWLPGAVIFRLPIADRARRAALPAEERLFWAIVISLALSLAAVLALAATGRYTFERLLLIDGAVALGAAALGRFDLRLRGARRPDPGILLPVLLIALGLWRFFPPSEYVIGGKDPGVYINEGIQMAQRGTFVYDDPLVASVPAATRDLFFPSHDRPEYYGIRFMGFFIRDPDLGRVVGQFPHLFPASIAVAYGIDGLSGARRATGIWAILGLLAVYLAAARLIGRTAAFAGAALLGVHVIQVWFARYPNSEVVMQALLFAALLASARAHVDGDRFFAPVAGVLLGLLLFLRIDALLAIAGVAAGLALLVLTGGRVKSSFILTLALLMLAAGAYYIGPMRAYAERPIVFVTHLQPWQYGLIAVGAGTAVAALLVGRRLPMLGARLEWLVPRLLTGALVLAAIYALHLREPGGRLAAHDAYALRTFTSYYLTLPGLIAALLGFAIVAHRAFWRAPAMFATLTLFSFFFFYKIHIVPDHFWMARRFVPVILPAALLLAAGAALAASTTGRRTVRLVRLAVGIAFLVLLAGQYSRASRPVLDHVEYAGVIPNLEQLAASIAEEDLLVVESRNAATDVHTLALPLAYIYARQVLVLDSPLPDKVAFATFLQWAWTQYARVLFLGAGGTDLMSPLWNARSVTTDRFQVPEYDAPQNAYPRFIRRKQFDYTVYELTPPDEPPEGDEDGEVVVDVGTGDDLNVLRFHAKEETEGRTFRWSRDVSYITLPRLHAASRSVTLWMNDGGRPAGAPPARVTVSLEENALGSVLVASEFRPYTVAIPQPLASRMAAERTPVRLTLTSTTWSPDRLLGTGDDRELGVMVDRVEVR